MILNADLTSETQARLAAIVDSSDDAIVSKTLDGIITSWNRAAEKIFGYAAGEAIGQHITLIVPPEKLTEEEHVLARLRRGEKIDHFETERRARDGRKVYVSLSVSPVRNAQGDIIGAAKVARDITEARQAEWALQVSERYRQAVLDGMPECVKVLDPNGHVLHMNPAGLRMIEADSPDLVIGQCIYPLIRPDCLDAFRALNQSVFTGGSGGRLEFAIRSFSGTERIFESNVVPLRGAHDEVIGALSVTRDVTSTRQAEKRDAFLVHLDNETRGLADPKQIAQIAARLLCENMAADRCSYAEIDAEKGFVDITGCYSTTMPDIRGRYSAASFGTEFLAAMTAGRPYVFRDAARELPKDVAAAYRSIGIAAVTSIPLLKGDRLVAGMGLHQAKPRNWHDDEIELIRVVANRCWESIQRARVERELRTSEQEFRTLANAIPNLAWMAHADGYLFWYNQRWYDYTGMTPEQTEGWGWQSAQDPETLPKVLERWKASIATGQSFEMVFPLKGADGRFRPFLTRVEPLKDADGRVLRWLGTNTDVTAQQEAEDREKRARVTAELLNRVGPLLAAELDPRRLTQRITDIATEAVHAQFGSFFHSSMDETGESYVLYTLSGISQEEFAKLPMPRITRVFGPTFRGEGVVRSDDITKDPRYGNNPPYHGLPDGHPPVRSYLAVPVVSRNRVVVGSLLFGHSDAGVFTTEAEAIVRGIAAQAGIALDNASLLDEEVRSGEALRNSNVELTRLNEDLNQFAYSASHDLREPLRMVAIYTQLLGRKLANQLDAEGREYLSYVLKGASRMEALVRDLLAYTQATESVEVRNPRSDANEALNGALANLAPLIRESGAKVTASELPAVRIPEVRLTQILQNLLENAIKYRSEAPLEIAVQAVRQRELWEFSVADNGIGIDEQYKEHIFGVFKRLHSTDAYPGTGIGLAICQRIVQRAGGQIWVEAGRNGGSIFRFTLPPADRP